MNCKIKWKLQGQDKQKCTLQNKHECKIFPYAIEKYHNDLKYTIKANKNLICNLFDYSIINIPMKWNVYFHFAHWLKIRYKKKMKLPLRSYCYFFVYIKTYEKMMSIIENQKRWIMIHPLNGFLVLHKSSINPFSNCLSNFRFHYWWECILKLVTFYALEGNRYMVFSMRY